MMQKRLRDSLCHIKGLVKHRTKNKNITQSHTLTHTHSLTERRTRTLTDTTSVFDAKTNSKNKTWL